MFGNKLSPTKRFLSGALKLKDLSRAELVEILEDSKCYLWLANDVKFELQKRIGSW